MGRPPRRSVALATLGFLHLGMGLRLLLTTESPVDPDIALLHMLIPVPVRVGLWIFVGTMCILLAWRPRTERIGWAVAMMMPIERAVSYFWSGAMAVVPGPPPGAMESFGAMMFWMGVGFLIWLMSGWTESGRVPN